jgi:hypothetical protein
MNSRYRLIHFVPDHFSGERIPIGAVVSENGAVRVAIADRTPGAECLGSDARYMLLRDTLDELRQLHTFERLPMAVGPHFEMSAAKELPQIDTDPIVWLQQTILPRSRHKPSKAKKYGPTRSKIGLNYLQQFDVAKYVKQFRPTRDLHELNGASEMLPTISQGVRGASDLLLMEPVVPTRHQLDNDLKTIGTNFFAYRGALQKHQLDTNLSLVAYVIPGGGAAIRTDIIERLSASADSVYDTTEMCERQELVHRVSDVGQSGLERISIQPEQAQIEDIETAIKHKPTGVVHRRSKGEHTGCGIDTTKNPSHWELSWSEPSCLHNGCRN